MMKKATVIALIIVAGAAASAGLLYSSLGKERGDKDSARTVLVRRGDIAARVAETGSIEPATVVEIKSEQSGLVKKLYVKEGDAVKGGQDLAVIQQESSQARQAAQLRATLEQERLNVEEARKGLERQRRLHAKGFISTKDLEEAEKNYGNAVIKYDLASRQLLLALGGKKEVLTKYLERDLSSDQLDEFLIASPISGTVVDLAVEEGEIVASGTSTVTGGTTLMKVADLSRMLVKTKINEVNVARLTEGLPAEIRFDAIPGRVYHGKVIRISPRGERVNNIVTYLVTVEITHSGSDLKPSMTANVDITTAVLKNVLFLPVEAIARVEGEDGVYLMENGRSVFKKVGVGLKTERSAVMTEGLAEGDRVMLPPREKG